MREPLIIKYPGFIKEGLLNDTPVIAYDLFPTISHLLEFDDNIINDIDGVNISTTWGANSLYRDEPLFWAFHTRENDDPFGISHTARKGDWKLIHDQSQIIIFYMTYHMIQMSSEICLRTTQIS